MTNATASGLADALADRYTLERELGRGGMATVYLARDLKHDRPVALKVLGPELVGALGRERFIREIRLTARLDHPHILPVFDSGAASGLLWYTMPFVDGESLRDRLCREGQLSTEETVRLAGEMADALDCAHRHEVVHRDVKPENVLLAQGHARVADFGLARAVEAAAGDQLTATGLTMGTPAYMAPEQASGGPVDARADVYALGCVTYEMLAGEPPYTGPSAQAIISKRFVDPVPSVRRLRPEVPEHVDAAIRRALARTPADRFPTAGSFAGALRDSHAVEGRGRRAGLRLAGRTFRRSWALAITVALLVVAGLAWRFTAGGHPGMERIAVYPFANRTGEASLDALGSLSADWIAQAVSRVPGVELVSVPSLMVDSSTAGAANMGRASLGKLAGAHTMIWGSIYRTGDSVRLVANLTNVARGSLLASVEATAATASPEAGVQLLAERVSTGVLARVSRDTVEMLMRSNHPPTFAAFQAFAEGMTAWESDGRKAAELFERAVSLDSTFLSPLVWAGFIYRNHGEYARADSIGSIAERRRERLGPFEQAALDRMLAEVRGDNERAYAASRRVLAAAPSSDWAKCVTAEAALWVNRPREALHVLEGVETRPGIYNGAEWCDLVPIQAWLMVDDGARALAAARRWGRKWDWGGTELDLEALALAHLGRVDESRVLVDSARGWPLAAMMVGHELRRAGDRAGARAVFEHIAGNFRHSRDTAERAGTWGGVDMASAGEALYWAGHWDEASTIFRQLTGDVNFAVRAHGVLGVLAARRENQAEARAEDAWLAGVDPRHRRGEVSVWRARIAAALGERDRAVELLRRAFAEGQTQDYFGMYGPGMAWFRQDPHFESLRDFPPYVALLRPRG